MKSYRWLYVVPLLLGLAVSARDLRAQGVTTGAITGTVTESTGEPVPAAEVRVVNRATGYTSNALTRSNGMYLVPGLEVGSRYTVTVSRIGYQTFEQNNVVVTLNQATRVDVTLTTQAVQLAGLEAVATRTDVFSPTRQGIGTTVTDSIIRRAPTLSRDWLDLVKITPQVVRPQDGNGPSAGGQYNRFNNFTIDGANQSDKFNLASSGGSPGSAAGVKTISVEAIKEFRVFMSPTDVRLGNFTGMLVNAVTKSGTNDWSGGATFTYRDESLAHTPSDTLIVKSPFQVQQYSLQLGGPIIKDKLHFFVAPEFQRRNRPASGPYFGSVDINVAKDSVNRIINAAKNNLGIDPGSGDPVDLENPTMNLFGRLDYAINDRHRLVFRQIYNTANDDDFSRNTRTFNTSVLTQTSGFRLSSNMYQREHENFSSVGQLFSTFANGWTNEILVGYNKLRDERIIPVKTPEMSIAVVPLGATNTSPTAAVTMGTEQFSPNNLLKQDILELTENLTIPFGAHTFTVGGRFENTNMYNNFAQRSYGVWIFPNIAAFEQKAPSGYAYGYPNSQNWGDVAVDFGVQLFSFYAQDQWAVSPRLNVNFGLRADMPRFSDQPTKNDTIAKLWTAGGGPGTLNTSLMPETQVLLSPRFGFNYDVNGDQSLQLRGNIGVFTGAPPYILLGNAYANTGLGLVTLSCSGSQVPGFTIDVDNLPKSCAGVATPAPGAAGTAGINTNDPDFKYPQSFVASAGLDKRLPWDVVLTLEGLYRHAINGVLIRDRNLRGPRLNTDGSYYTDKNGRALYADTISSSGSVTNTKARYITSVRGVNFGEGIIDVTNQSKDYNYTLSGQLSKRFSDAFQMQGSYTYMKAMDIQSLTSDRAISNFRNGAQFAGNFDDMEPTTSYFSRPHRIVVSGTYTAPWKTTDISAYFEGISGTPYTYVYSGDMNGDGVTANDPIYVPTDAANVNEIKLGTLINGVYTQDAAAAQRFNMFIDKQSCLDEQRGKIMERNSCRSPFQKRMDVSLRQSLPDIAALRGHSLSLQLDMFNFLGLLKEDWGRLELPTLSSAFPQQSVLTSTGTGTNTGRTAGPLNQSMPVVQFNSTVANMKESEPLIFRKETSASNFYQVQLTLRWSF